MSVIFNQVFVITTSGTPIIGGADKQVLFNDGGFIGSDAGLTYDKATDSLFVGARLGVGVSSFVSSPDPSQFEVGGTGANISMYVGPTDDNYGNLYIRGGTAGTMWTFSKRVSGDGNAFRLYYYDGSFHGPYWSALTTGNIDIPTCVGNLLQFNTVQTNGDFNLNNGSGKIAWNSRSKLHSGADSQFLMTNDAETDFSMLIWGDETSSFPAIKRSSTSLQIRLGDDSAYGDFGAQIITVGAGTATTSGGSTGAKLVMGTTTGFGIYYGSSTPTISAGQGSLYMRSDGSSTTTRLYVNTTGGSTWTNFASAA